MSEEASALALNGHIGFSDHTTRVPDEILDTIIRETGPRHGTAARSTGFDEKRNWLSCASVCRRWHRISLPHSMRYIRITESSWVDHYNKPTASNFKTFLQENPSITRLIQEVNFLKVTMTFSTLSSIIAELPNLRCLVFHCSMIEQDDLESEPVIGERKIDELIYLGGACETIDCSPTECGRQATQLLSLFLTIEEFEEIGGCCYHEEFYAA